MITAYRAGRIFDGLSEQIIEDGAVLVEDGRIVSIGAPQKPPPGVGVLDLGDATLLPGLIDAYVHLVWSASGEPHEVVQQEGRALTALRCAKKPRCTSAPASPPSATSARRKVSRSTWRGPWSWASSPARG